MFVRIREIKSEMKRPSVLRSYVFAKRLCAGKCQGRHRKRWRNSYKHGSCSLVTTSSVLEGCPLKPPCPYRIAGKVPYRLAISLIENRRVGGKIRQEHVANLGAILGEYLPEFWHGVGAEEIKACRQEAWDKWSFWIRHWFWQEVEARLARLANRIGPDMEKIRRAIADRIPPVSEEEWKQLDETQWEWLERNWAGLLKRDIDEIAAGEEKIRKRRARIAEETEPVIAEIKHLRAAGRKYEDTREAGQLNNAYAGRIFDSI